MAKNEYSKSERSRLFYLGGVIGLTALSIAFASTAKHGSITDDTALYDSLSEIRVPRQGKINFDEDIAKLSRMEAKYEEPLPGGKSARVNRPSQRISQQKYRFSGDSSARGQQPQRQ
jgi:hypothetical protein